MRNHYRFIHDAGHGWLEVHRDDLAELGLSEGDFSEFSYKNGGFFYLEEDCDAGLFIGYHDSIMGYSPKYTEHDHGNWSRIRNFQRCTPTTNNRWERLWPTIPTGEWT